jgi:hypothetical protein
LKIEKILSLSKNYHKKEKKFKEKKKEKNLEKIKIKNYYLFFFRWAASGKNPRTVKTRGR